MAKKAQSTLVNMLLSLTAIALVAAAALAALNAVTKAPIEAAQKAKVENAISAVLPAFDRLADTTIDGNVCHIGYDAENNIVGAAVEASDNNAFGGNLRVMVGFDATGGICGYRILETHETPGLGAKAETWFQREGKGAVVDKNPAETNLTVKKDGGDIDAISGSTITSRAFLRVVAEAYKSFQSLNN